MIYLNPLPSAFDCDDDLEDIEFDVPEVTRDNFYWQLVETLSACTRKTSIEVLPVNRRMRQSFTALRITTIGDLMQYVLLPGSHKYPTKREYVVISRVLHDLDLYSTI